MKNQVRWITKNLWGNRKIVATRLVVGATILVSCSVIAANFNDAKENLSTSTCGLGEGIAMMPVDYSSTSTDDVAIVQSASTQIQKNGNAGGLPSVSSNGNADQVADAFVALPALSVEDRHWQMAEALKVALDRKARTIAAE